MRTAVIAPQRFPVLPSSSGGIEAALDVPARGLHAADDDALLDATGDTTCSAAEMLDERRDDR